MNSCTSALEVALRASNLRGEVIIPSFTWVATANAVVTSGCTPVFCEVDAATRNMTAASIADKLSERTAAVIVVHFGGQPCQMDDIVALCRKHDLLLIEDSAETLGARWRGKQAGSFGVGCFSFFPTKNITTAEGGMLTCDDDALATRARAMISHGIDSTTLERERAERPWIRAASMAGHNYRMPNPLAALGHVQLERLEQLNKRRLELARRYDAVFATLSPALKPPVLAAGATHVYQMYTVEVEPELRDRFVLGLRERGIGASVHFDPPVHLQPYYMSRGGGEGALPVTERLSRSIATLPLFPDMTDEQQELVVDAVTGILSEA
jgi:perosamine synthetase